MNILVFLVKLSCSLVTGDGARMHSEIHLRRIVELSDLGAESSDLGARRSSDPGAESSDLGAES